MRLEQYGKSTLKGTNRMAEVESFTWTTLP